MSKETVVVLNILKMERGNQASVMELLEQSTREVIRTLKGWVSTRLIASADGGSIVIYSEWETETDVAAMRSGSRMVAYFLKIRELATFESVMGHVVLSENSGS